MNHIRLSVDFATSFFLVLFLHFSGNLEANPLSVYYDPAPSDWLASKPRIDSPENCAVFTVRKYAYLHRLPMTASLQKDLQAIPPDRQVSIFELRMLLKELGVESKAYQLDSEAVLRLQHDFIAHFQPDHFAMVRPHRGRFYVYDTAPIHVKTLTLAELMEHTNGFAIVTTDDDENIMDYAESECSFQGIFVNGTDPNVEPLPWCQFDFMSGICLLISSPDCDLQIEDLVSPDVQLYCHDLPITIKAGNTEEIAVYTSQPEIPESFELVLFNSRKEALTVHLFTPSPLEQCPCSWHPREEEHRTTQE